jgi:hypothetical protein
MMSAGEADRDLIYFTFNDSLTVMKLEKLIDLIERHKMNIGQIYNIIIDYLAFMNTEKIQNNFDLCQFFEKKLFEIYFNAF